MALSRRMCGQAGVSPAALASARRGGRKFRKLTGSSFARARVAGSCARDRPQLPADRPETARPRCGRRIAVAPKALARQRHADNARQPAGARLGLRLARCPQRRQRQDLHLGPREDVRAIAWSTSRRRSASSRSWLVWCRWSALVAANSTRSMRRHAEDAAEPGVGPGRKHLRMASSAWAQIGQRLGPAVERPTGRRSARFAGRGGRNAREKTAARPASCSFRTGAPAWRRGVPRWSPRAFGRQRKEGQERRAGKIARQQEAARPRRDARGVGARGPPAR